MKRPDLPRLFGLAVLAFCTLKLAFLAFYTWNATFIMDEYGLGSFFTLHQLGELYDSVDPIKTVLHVVLYKLAVVASDDAVTLMQLARVETFLLALGVLGLVWAIARRIGATRTEALFGVAVLLAFSTFLERVFRVRSETLAVLFALLALWAAVRLRSWQAPLLAGIWAGCAFLTTQKAVYYFVALGGVYLVSYLSEAWHHRSAWRGLGDGLLFGAGWGAALLLYALAFGGLDFPRVLAMVFTSPMEVAFEADDHYDNLRAFVTRTLVRNKLPYALCFAGLVIGLTRLRSLSRNERFVWLATAIVAALVFAHNQPWPYVFVMALPFLALSSIATLRLLASSAERQAVVGLVLVTILSLPFGRSFDYLGFDNVEQSKVLSRAEALLGPGDRYLDGTGMVVTRRQAGTNSVWDAMSIARIRRAAAEGDTWELDEIFAQQPKLWIYNFRLEAIRNLLAPYLEESYVRIDRSIFLTGVVLEPGREVDFVSQWAGRYRLYGQNGRAVGTHFTVDGREVGNETLLQRGRFRIAFAASARAPALLLPAGVEIPPQAAATGRLPPLYAGVYD